MCCFSQPVEHVSDTRIFARTTDGGRQVLAYAMSLSAAADVAMVLPLPIPPGCGDDAVRFIDLEGYSRLFDDMDKAFPAEWVSAGAPETKTLSLSAAQRLVVHEVGAFEASFVPSPGDFDRLDPRFRLDPEVLASLSRLAASDHLPERYGPNHLDDYGDYGFAVFQLRGFEAPRGFFDRLLRRKPTPSARDFHPMAFEFPRRDPGALFFPTVHAHGGPADATAWFNHALYCQADATLDPSLAGWTRSEGPASRWLDVPSTRGTVLGDAPLWRLQLLGTLRNLDTWVGPASRSTSPSAPSSSA